jgi:hypothetical protein
MQFFDLSRQFNLSNILTPPQTLQDLEKQDWILSKIRIEYNCLTDSDILEGQAVLKSNQNIHIELEWMIQDTGHELQVLFKGIETPATEETLITIKGANLVDQDQQALSSQTLSLWIDGILLPMLPHIRKDIKARLNLWDYVEYDG